MRTNPVRPSPTNRIECGLGCMGALAELAVVFAFLWTLIVLTR